MPITIKDINDKVFTKQVRGYSIEEVDDFLDELAAQVGAMTNENQALSAQVKELQAALAAAKAENAEMEKKLPDYNEAGYFKQLETAMRESMIGAQRIADETIAEANKKAQQTIDTANAKAEKTVADAEANAKAETERAEKVVAELKAESDRLHAVVEAYRANFQKLLDEQAAALKAGVALLK